MPIAAPTTQDSEYLRNYIRQACGIVLTAEKEYLIRHRLEPVIESRKLTGYPDLCKRLAAGETEVREALITALTTNETSFFRDGHPWKAFAEKLLPEMEALIVDRKSKPCPRKGSKVRIWCAASSTGQEPYTMAMLIREHAERPGSRAIMDDYTITATDISPRVLSKAMSGVYTSFELERGLDTIRRSRHFHEKSKGLFTIEPNLQRIVEFRRLNLAETFLFLGGFDLILCRNVLIYFDDNLKKQILLQFHQLLADGGALMLGASESLYALNDSFDSVNHKETILYRKKGQKR